LDFPQLACTIECEPCRGEVEAVAVMVEAEAGSVVQAVPDQTEAMAVSVAGAENESREEGDPLVLSTLSQLQRPWHQASP